MDELDQASLLEADFLARSIEANRKPKMQMRPSGKCYNCTEPVEGEKLFCESSCREDWEIRMKRRNNYQVFEGAS